MMKLLGWTMVAVMSLGGLAACSSDKDSPSTTKATTPAGGSTAASAGESSGNAAVDEFCKQADDLAGKLKDVIANPTSANAAEVTAAASKLSTDAAALISANPNDTAKINECVKKLTDAATPNG